MQIPLRNGLEYEVPTDFLAELNSFYYGVEDELYKMRLWCLANPDRRKTSRGARRFVFSWINKACKVKPRPTPTAEMPAATVTTESLETRKSRLAELKAMLK